MKTIVYVDGYNLFYGCLKHSAYKWLDVWSLFFEHILHSQQPATNAVALKYFTADIRAKVASRGQAAAIAQQTYHRALQQLYPDHLHLIKGYYSLEKAHLLRYAHPPQKTERVNVWKLEEKQTDVNIALEAYRDAARGSAEQLVFVSNDSDLAPALRAIRMDFGESIQLGLVIPVRKKATGRPGNQQLSQYANWTRRYIRDEELQLCQLPESVPTRKKPIYKPTYW